MKTFKTKEELRDWAMYIVPEDAKWIAVDKDSGLWCYYEEPEKDEEGFSTSIADAKFIARDVSISFSWHESSIEIEHPVDLTKYIGKVVKIVEYNNLAFYSILTERLLQDKSKYKSITPLKHEDIQPDTKDRVFVGKTKDY